MTGTDKNILAINGGSSSIKFALYSMQKEPVKRLSGKVDRIGLEGAKLTYKDDRSKGGELSIKASNAEEAASSLLAWLDEQNAVIAAIGHRVVHGMEHRAPQLVDGELLKDLERISVYDPDHLPGELALIRLFEHQTAGVPQVVCFDTAFHATLPRLARLLPLPRRLDEAGIQRYGFHGLSYTYIMEELNRVAGPVVAVGRVILAHLGNGASLAAVRNGESIDTTMGFTPTGGVMMGTRPGDLDPGVIGYLLQREGLTPKQLDHLLNHEAGLLGVSGSSSDMQDLLGRESSDLRAAEAVGLFCYQVRKAIGSFSAVLGGVDALVFTGGIGEKSPVIRSRICAGLEYLGVEVDARENEGNSVRIGKGAVGVYAIPTDEEVVIARAVWRLVNGA